MQLSGPLAYPTGAEDNEHFLGRIQNPGRLPPWSDVKCETNSKMLLQCLRLYGNNPDYIERR